MASPDAVLIDATAMTWEDYAALPEDASGEYVDGHLLIAPSPNQLHQRICSRFTVALEGVLPHGYRAIAGWSWHPRPDVEFIPDVMVYPDTDETTRFTGIPLLCVEILSSNRASDLVVKTTRYAALGVDHYWVVDADAATLTAFVRDEATYRAECTVGAAAQELDFGVASARIDLAALTR